MAAGSGYLLLPITEPILSDDGEPVSGATLSWYEDGLTSGTLADLFSDNALSVPIANPLTSDSAGRFYDQTTTIWASDAMAYGAVVHLPTGQTLTFEDRLVLSAATDISGLAPINSPTFTGVPQAPTPAINDNSAKIATTAYVQGQDYAPLASPTFTGVPAGPTAAVDTHTTQLATTAFVVAQIAGHQTSGYFQSGNITISHAGNGTVTHTLGVNPTRVQAIVKCTASINGITTGDEIPVGINTDNSGCLGPQVWAVNDSTTLKYQFGNNGLSVMNTAGNQFDATSANFVMIIRAWAN